MKNKIKGLILLLFSLFVLINCGPSPKERLASSGLFGEHELLRIENFGAIQGSISDSFFLGSGSINGSIGSEFKIQFYWSPKPKEIIATALPYSKFRFIIDDTKKTPTIEFIFNYDWLNKKTDRDYSEKTYPNLNDFILDSTMELVRVKISRATLEKEVYLPKIR